MKIRTLFLFLALSGLSASTAFSWGSEGHDVVVKMALRMMKPSEKKAAFDLLGTHDTYVIGNWADSVKKMNGTSKLHYVDIAERDVRYNPERDCANGNCIIAKLDQVKATIQDHTQSKQKRREALLYWFHLVGDLYQPFHCYKEHHGGNDIHVSVYFKKKPTNLHALWDNGIIHYKNPSASNLADEIFDAHVRPTSANTTFIDAALQSHERAVNAKVKNNTEIDSNYVQSSWSTIQACLWEAACMASTIGPDL